MLPRHAFRRPNALLLLAAFAAVLQWAVPHGWMVGADALLVPCPSVSPELAALRRSDPGPAAPAAPASDHAAHMHHGHHAAGAMPEMPAPPASAGHEHHPVTHTAAAPADPAGHAEHDRHDTHDEDASALCDFAALGAPVLLPGPPDLLPQAPQPVALLAATLPGIVPGRGLAAPPPPSTGPPHLPA